jgi:serine/threonine-protein kinase
MAEVFLCRLRGMAGFDKLVVVKRIRPDLTDDKEFVTMFFDEARLAANLNHKNIVQVFEADQIDGVPYIAMEYANGATMAAVCQRLRDTNKPNPYGILAWIFAGVCAGLDHAHKAEDASGKPLHIVHRDISPHNIIVSLDGTAKVFDFGVAKARSSIALTDANRIKGKVAYMAPEQLRAHSVDAKADVFALGVCLYEAMVGKRPFSGGTEGELFAARVNGTFPAPRELAPDVPRELEQIILRAMITEPEARPSAAELEEALLAFAAKEKITQKDVASWLADEIFPKDVNDAYELYSSSPSVVPIQSRSILLTQAQGLPQRRGGGWKLGVVACLLAGAALAIVLLRPSTQETPAATSAPSSAGHAAPIAVLPPAAAPSEQAKALIAKAAQALDAGRLELAETLLADAEPLAKADPVINAEVLELTDRLAVARQETTRSAQNAGPPTEKPTRPPKGRPPSRPPGRVDRADQLSMNKLEPEPKELPPKEPKEPKEVAIAPGPGPEKPPGPGPGPGPEKPPGPGPGPEKPPGPAPEKPLGPGSLDAIPSITKFQMSGALTDAEVRSALERAKNGFRACYREAAARQNKTPAMSVKLGFVIDEGRGATQITVDNDPLGVAGCMREAARVVRTSNAPDTGIVHVAATVKFSPVP